MPRPEGPLGPGRPEVEDFAAGLRRLREKAGGPGYRELARRAHFSATTLSDAAGGRRLPTLAVTLAFVEACGGEPAEWERRWRAVESGVADAAPVAGDTPPYQGLATPAPPSPTSAVPELASGRRSGQSTPDNRPSGGRG